MNNFKCSQSDREQFRTDFSNQFLLDYLDSLMVGHDPRNRIGLQCGVNNPRVLQIAQDRMIAGTL